MTRWVVIVLVIGFGTAVAGQAPVLRGAVFRADAPAPIGGAIIHLIRDGSQVATGPDGAFALAVPVRRDTLIVTAIGFRPDTVPLPAELPKLLTIVLRRVSVTLADLVGSAAEPEQYATGSSESWAVSGKALDGLPATIEPDISRALALVPGVTFSSLFSARPILRGLNADDVTTSIDGFEAINLYHAGRIFSAMPALAIDHADVRFQPASADMGGTTSGQVNVVGRTADSPSSGDVQFGEGASSVAAGVASKDGTRSIFAAARTAKTSLISQQLAEQNLDYAFDDLYANVHVAPLGVATQLSLFTSSDHLTGDTLSANYSAGQMNWSNLLIGLRSDLVSSEDRGVVASLAYARHAEDGTSVLSRGVGVNINSMFANLTGRVDGHQRVGHGSIVGYGADIVGHNIQNEVTPTADQPRFLATNRNDRLSEVGGYGEMTIERGRVAAAAGVRVDHAGSMTVAQPRLSIRVTGAHRSWVELAVGRSARLFDIISDVQSEATDASYAFWRAAGVDGTPVATMTNASLAAVRIAGRWQFRADLFGAWGNGAADLKAHLSDADSAAIFRYGQSRVHGADAIASASAADGRWSAALSYTWLVSERNWGSGWVPAINDRRHEGRIFGTYRVGSAIHLSSSLEAGSPLPFTPIVAWVVVPQTEINQVRPVYGAEMSGRGTAFLRMDAAALASFRGPWGTRWEAGVGISNVSWGDQALRVDSLFDGVNSGRPGPPYVTEQPAFAYKAIPSILLRGQIGTAH